MLAVTAPDTPKLVNVPTDVMLGCAAVVTVPAVVALPAVATLKLATCVVDVTTNGAVPVANVLVICPVALTVVNAPVLAVVAPIVPLCAPNVGALTLPAPILPVTVNELNVPTEVMLG